MHTHIGFLVLLMSMHLFVGCDKDKGEDTETSFDRSAMLTSMADQIILPSYEAFNDQVTALDAAASAFSNGPSLDRLGTLQSSFVSAYQGWQSVSFLAFGPALEQALKSAINTYPVDTQQVVSNVASGSTNLDLLSNADAKGFPALDYLLYHRDSARVLELFTTDNQAANRIAYLQAVVTEIATKTATTVENWRSQGGNYRQTFVSSTGADAGSSMSLLFNAYLQHCERNFRDGKVGIPTGIRTSGIAFPEKSEAFFSGRSVQLAMANLCAIERLYLGNDTMDNAGQGLDDNLVAADGAELNSSIQAQFTAALNALKTHNDPLSEAIENDQQAVESTYEELQKLLVLLKVDLSSRLGILITYQDNDGD